MSIIVQLIKFGDRQLPWVAFNADFSNNICLNVTSDWRRKSIVFIDVLYLDIKITLN